MAATGGHWIKGARFTAENAKSDGPLGDRTEKPWDYLSPGHKRKAARPATQKADQKRRDARRENIRGGRAEDQQALLAFVADHEKLGTPGYIQRDDMLPRDRQMWFAQQALVQRGWLEVSDPQAWPTLRITERGRRALARLSK